MTFRVSMKAHISQPVEMLEGLAERLADLRPAWLVVQKIFYNIEKELFDSNGASGASGEWPPLADATVRKKIAAGYSPEQILQATRALKNSLTAPNQLGSRRVMTPHTLEIGTAINSAAFHDTGTEHMPQRRPVDPTQEDMLAMVAVVDRYVAGTSLL